MAGDADGELLSIGDLARASGLSISALRFYDRQGVIEPAEVSAHSGYRWYTPPQVEDARLVAALRRVGLPLPEVAAVMVDRHRAARTLTEHVRRLEEGLALARAETSLIQAQWSTAGPGQATARGGEPEPAGAGSAGAAPATDATVTVRAGALAEGLRTVRHTVGEDPDMPSIHGVFLVGLTGAVRLASTDRVRCTFAEVDAECTGALRVLVPTEQVDHLLSCLTGRPGDARLTVAVQSRRLTVRDEAGPLIATDLPAAAFPDLSHAIPTATGTAVLDVDHLRRTLDVDPGARAWWLGADGSLAPGRRDTGGGGASSPEGGALLDPVYLAEALDALTQGEQGRQLRLDLDGPAHPLALRRTDDPRTFVVLLPLV